MTSKRIVFSLCLLVCGNIKAESDVDAFQHVFDVIAAPRIYSSTWDELLRRLKPWCKAGVREGRDLIKYGNVECREVVSAGVFDVSTKGAGQVSMIETSFIGSTKCAYMKKVLIRNFGKPTTAKGECDLDWWLPTLKQRPRRFVALGASTKNDKVYFSVGEEQGP